VDVLQLRAEGLYCAAGEFFIDPSGPVERAVITHAHSDHARPGSRAYLTSRTGEAVLRARLGADARIQTAEYGEAVTLGGARVSLHPAGHILGSAQVRIEVGGEVWVVSGDYKLAVDSTCAAFEPLRCHTFVTESTFGLPIFRWPAEHEVAGAIHAWWRGNQEAGRASILFAHPLGKAQRVLALLDALAGPIYTHGAVERMNAVYRAQGIRLAPTTHAGAKGEWARGLIVAPPLSHGSATRRRRSLDRGFVLSDHADWTGLLQAIGETQAESVWVTHGFRAPLERWLAEHGRMARAVAVEYEEAETAEEAEP
jgi:putative mRNA 3-end processing factor